MSPCGTCERRPPDVCAPALCRLHFVFVHREALSFVCMAAHDSGVSSIDDRLKCQTATATPAEPGELPFWFSPLNGNSWIALENLHFPDPTESVVVVFRVANQRLANFALRLGVRSSNV